MIKLIFGKYYNFHFMSFQLDVRHLIDFESNHPFSCPEGTLTWRLIHLFLTMKQFKFKNSESCWVPSIFISRKEMEGRKRREEMESENLIWSIDFMHLTIVKY